MNYPPIAPAIPAPKASPQSIWSLILGILSIVALWIIGSIPAIILGVIGMRKTSRDPESVGGKGLALAGIITGSVGIFFSVLPIVIAIAIPAFAKVNSRAEQAKEMSNIRQTFLACQIYAQDFGGEFPESLDQLIPDYLDDDRVLYVGKNSEPQKILYRPGLADSSPPDEPILLSPIEHGGQQTVVYVGGNLRTVPSAELDDVIAEFR